MFKKYKDYFRCPNCGSNLDYTPYLESEEIIIDGLYSCSCGEFYPIIESIPRFISKKDITEVVASKTLKSFSQKYELPEEYKNILHQLDGDKFSNVANLYKFMWGNYDTNFDHYDREELLRLTGSSFNFTDISDKSVLDAGAGQGRFVFPYLEAGVKEVICVDMGGAIELLYKKFKDDSRVLAVQGDLYKLPFKNKFDIVSSIGVLQHLPNPKLGFERLVDYTKKSGTTQVWVYGNSSIKVLLIIIRKILSKFSDKNLWIIAWWFALVRWIISSEAKLFRKIGLNKIADILPFSMYEGYSFHYLRVNSFDHISTKIINFFTENDIKKWCSYDKISECIFEERFPKTSASSWIIRTIK